MPKSLKLNKGTTLELRDKKLGNFKNVKIKNVQLPSLMMKVPDHLYV
jgi:hypothetical protein